MIVIQIRKKNYFTQACSVPIISCQGRSVCRYPKKNDISLINFKVLSKNHGDSKSFSAKLLNKKKSDKYFFSRANKITNHLVDLRVGIYVGNKFQSFKVYPSLIGIPLFNFVQTKKHNINKELLKKKNISSKKLTKKKLISVCIIEWDRLHL